MIEGSLPVASFIRTIIAAPAAETEFAVLGVPIKRPRITITRIGFLVAVVATTLAALRSGTAIWAGAMISITFFVMICSLLGVALERGMRRVYWSGFAALGWGYLILAYGPWLDFKIGRLLLGPNLFAYLGELLHAGFVGGGAGGFRSVPVAALGASATGGGIGGGWPFDDMHAMRIGISLEALFWAFAGGWVACYFAARRDVERAKAVEALAAVEHEQWIDLASFLTADEDISTARREQWNALMVPYTNLPEEQKEQDRAWARKALAALGEAGRSN
jgi:hypothetical protein